MELVNKEVKVNVKFTDEELQAIKKAVEDLRVIKCSGDPEIPCSQCPLFVMRDDSGYSLCIYVYLDRLAAKNEWSYIDEYSEDEKMDPVTLDMDTELDLFRKIIEDYGVVASYGAGMTMTIDNSFIDKYAVFGVIDRVMDQATIAPYWKALIQAKWEFDYDNPYVQSELSKILEESNV